MNIVIKIAVLLIGVLAHTVIAQTDSELPARPNLHGVIRNHQGNPLESAMVFISTAGPREGTGVLCPSCYLDCRKSATTDSLGRFQIAELDPTLLFRVLVVAKGFRPTFVSKVDPAAGPMDVNLSQSIAAESSNQQVRGRVTDPHGDPIAGAVVNLRGVVRGDTTRFGGNPDVDPVAVTDNAGEFSLNSTNAFDAAGVEVVARGFAKRLYSRLSTGGKLHALTLTPGASVRGRVLHEGKPLPGVVVGICGADRSSDVFVGDFSVATDSEGRFLFVNLPPKAQYRLYGAMNSLAELGAIRSRIINTGADDSVFDIGDLDVEPAHELAGRIRLTDGRNVPPKTRLLLSRENAWDSLQVEADSEGRFRFSGVPPELVTLHARISGYRITPRNASMDPLNSRLLGTVSRSVTNLVLELEPGEHAMRFDGDQISLRSTPLRGAEAGDPKNDVLITGRVVDADTDAPLSHFSVVPGRHNASLESTTRWMPSHKTDHTNGQFEISFPAQGQGHALSVEADGYLPQASGRLTGSTNLLFQLKRGENISGTLLKPDGQPLEGAAVYLLDMQNSIYVDGKDLRVRNDYLRQTLITAKTDASGGFSFKPQLNAFGIVVVDDAGYAELTLPELSEIKEVRVKPWARVEGSLLIGSVPGTNESVRLQLAQVPYLHHPRTFPPVHLYLSSRTGADGLFVFERVPPTHIEVYHEPRARDEREGTVAMSQTTKFTLSPGETRRITLGGTGRPVIGRIQVNGYDGTINWRNDVYTLDRIVPPPPEKPDHGASLGSFVQHLAGNASPEIRSKLREEMEARQEEFQQRTRAFYRSEAGLDHFFKQTRYTLIFNQEGSFRAEDVPGGKYQLRVDVMDGDLFSGGQTVASVSRVVEIPESPNGRSDEPFDLGTFTVQARNSLKHGQAAPDFEVTTVDGKRARLSDYKGKFLLLDFWAVWCGPCVAETPHLKETFATFKDNSRFAMLGLSLDPIASTPAEYAKKNDLAWTQGFLGEWSNTDVPSQYGVQGIPSIFLIGPDGKIIAKGLRGPAIKTAVEQALSDAQP